MLLAFFLFFFFSLFFSELLLKCCWVLSFTVFLSIIQSECQLLVFTFSAFSHLCLLYSFIFVLQSTACFSSPNLAPDLFISCKLSFCLDLFRLNLFSFVHSSSSLVSLLPLYKHFVTKMSPPFHKNGAQNNFYTCVTNVIWLKP